MNNQRLAVLSVATAILALSSASHAANLIVNGGFEESSSPTVTPTGWTNVGHSDGIITYANFGTPAYEGLNYYDLGGYGDASGPIGDGIEQSFATTFGTTYTVTFGLSSENQSGDETLTVAVGGVSHDYLLTVDGSGTFQKGFTTESFSFVADGGLSTLSFIHSAGQGGANDPMLDKVIVDASGIAAVPEPASVTLMLGALGLAGVLRTRRSSKTGSVG